MRRRPFLLLLQALIILAPLPFGGVGRVVTPLFFVCLLLVALLALQQPAAAEMPRMWTWVRRALFAVLAFLALQVIPLPWFLVKLVSPGTATVIASLLPEGSPSPAFHAISLVPMETFFQLLRWLAWALFFYALVRLEYTKQEFRSFLHAILASGLVQVLIAFVKYAAGNRRFFILFHANPQGAKDRFLTGTIANTDHFAFFLEIIFPLAVALFLAELLFYQSGEGLIRKIRYLADENRLVLAYLGAAVAFGAAIFLTGSRAGIMAFFISMLVFLQLSIFIQLSSPVRRKIRYVAIGIILLVVLIGFQETLSKFLSPSTIENNRLIYWSNAVRLIKKFPLFGCGFGTFKFAYFLRDPLQTTWLTHAHNEYVETMAEGGFLGMILVTFLVLAVMAAIFRAWIGRNRPDVKALVLGILVSFLAAGLHLAFEFALRIPANTLLLVLLAALGLRFVHFGKRGERGAN